MTACVAFRKSGKWTTATVEGTTGASRIVTAGKNSQRAAHQGSDASYQLTLGNDAQRPLRANEQLRQVKTCG